MFKQLKTYYFLVSLPFVLLLTGSAIFFDAIKLTITRNPHPQINYTIFVIIVLGGLLILLNSYRLISEARILVDFSKAIHAKISLSALQELASSYTGTLSYLLQMVAASTGRSISHQEQVAIEHELTNARAGLIRRNALPQYLTGLLVGMGLLGTFIGLLATLNDISTLISSFADIDMQKADPLQVFRVMIERMKAPMQSMGIAFSASMFGLLGSIILGLMMLGIRRLQGDVFSLLSSEVGRHIEIALSHESVALESGEADSGNLAKSLIRIEGRYAEAARAQQRGLSTLIDDIQQQRTDMLRALTEQTGASNDFRGELQQLGRQLGSLSSSLEKGNAEMSHQVSELTIHLASDAKETHKLLALQVAEQQGIRADLDSYKIEERLAEVTRSQQRALSSVIDDFQEQRSEMLRALTEQTEANNNSRGELQQIGGQLSNIFNVIEKGNGEVSAQVSELTIQMTAEAKESQLLLENASEDFRNELQQLGSQLGTATEQGSEQICTQICELMVRMADSAKESHELLDGTNKNFSSELQQLGRQLGTVMESGDKEVCSQISELMVRMADSAKKSHELIDNTSKAFSGELQQLGRQLGTVVEKGDAETRSKISELMVLLASEAKASHNLLVSQVEEQKRFITTLDSFAAEQTEAGKTFCGGLQQLGGQLGEVIEQGNESLCTQIAELRVQLSDDTDDSHELPDESTEEQTD